MAEHVERRGQGLKGKVAYNNGEKTIWLKPDETVPDGFIKGKKPYMTDKLRQHLSEKSKSLWCQDNYRKTQTETHQGNPGTTAGKICITDGIVDKYIFPNELSLYTSWRIGSKKRGKALTCEVWNKGKTKDTDERVAKNGRSVAIALLGNIPWNKGLTAVTDERIRLAAEKQIGKVISAEQRKKISVANSGKKRSEEEKSATSRSLKIFWKNHPDVLKARNQKLKLFYSSAESRAMCSKRTKDAIKRDPTIITRGKETKRKLHTFHVSTPEKDFYNYLLTKFDAEDIIKEYKDDVRYPFYCDFYIKSRDLFIELNIHPTHGDHPFNPESIEDVLLLSELEKQENQWAKNIIDVWTVRDYNKIQTAKESKINYKVIYEQEYRTRSYNID